MNLTPFNRLHSILNSMIIGFDSSQFDRLYVLSDKGYRILFQMGCFFVQTEFLDENGKGAIPVGPCSVV